MPDHVRCHWVTGSKGLIERDYGQPTPRTAPGARTPARQLPRALFRSAINRFGFRAPLDRNDCFVRKRRRNKTGCDDTIFRIRKTPEPGLGY